MPDASPVSRELRIAIDDRAALRAWRADDAAPLFALVGVNRAHLHPWLDWVDGYTSIEAAHAFLRRTAEGYERGTGLDLALIVDGAIAGAAGISRYDRRSGSGRIGYWLAEAHEGRGLVTRACRALVAYAGRDLGLRDLAIRAATENARSRAVAERLGGTLVAIRARVDAPAAGQSGDEAVYVLSTAVRRR
jgi:ribosomal-protein-serine acetyltransferase